MCVCVLFLFVGTSFWSITTMSNVFFFVPISTQISNSPRKIPDTSHRMRPYFIPERSRTKSENADNHTNHLFDAADQIPNGMPTLNNNSTMMEVSCCDSNITGDMYNMSSGGGIGTINGDSDVNVLGGYAIGTPGPSSAVLSTSTTARKFALSKKSKSLEDVRAENIEGSLTSHEMEFVSSRIQKLKF